MKQLFLLLLAGAGTTAYAQQAPPKNPLLDSLINMTDTAALKQKIANMQQAGSETDQTNLILYFNVRRNALMRDSVYHTAGRRFPGSEFAFENARVELMKEEDPAKQRMLYLEMCRQYQNLRSKPMTFAMVEGTLANKRIEAKDVNGAIQYIDSITQPNVLVSVVRELYPLSPSKTLALLKKNIDNTPAVGDGKAGAVKSVYGHFLVQGKKVKEAAPYVKDAYTQAAAPRRSEELIQDYATVLKSEKQYETMVPLLEEAIVGGKGNAAVRTMLTEAYKKTGKDAEASMKKVNEDLAKKVREKMAAKMTNKAAPQFEVKDINGNTVSLSDFKGKTIILDFWATWCGPCKKSFPAMQMAANRYKNDDKVAFLFIHTWERGDKEPQKNATKYLKDNKYNFALYMDNFDEATKKNPAVSAFEVKGIPTKFVIDGEGNIRFTVIGFSAGDEAAAEEVSAMIELARQKS